MQKRSTENIQNQNRKKRDGKALKSLFSVFLTAILTVSLCFPVSAFAIDDVKDCVNPEHYGVKRSADIKDKKHKGKLNKKCYDKKERDEKIKKEFEEWKEAVKKANEEYTKVYNAYAESLNEKTTRAAELEMQESAISQKQAELNKIAEYSYKQNYSGSLLASLLYEGDFAKTINMKKYMDSTLQYMNQKADELRALREEKQRILDEVDSHIAQKKSEVIEAAKHINDSLPETSQELEDYIDEHSTEDFKSGRNLADKNLSDDWLIDVALYYVGTPYVWGGKDEKGADCSGFTSLVYKKALDKDIGVNTTAQYSNMDHIDKKDLQRTDVLFMDNASDSSQQHVGIFLEGNTYIHNSGTGTIARVDTDIDYFTCGLRLKQDSSDQQ